MAHNSRLRYSVGRTQFTVKRRMMSLPPLLRMSLRPVTVIVVAAARMPQTRKVVDNNLRQGRVFWGDDIFALLVPTIRYGWDNSR